MKELLKLAEEKGWKAKTLSTKWTVDCILERRKKFLINEQCKSNVLNEIQKWLRDEHKLIVEPIFDEESNDEFEWLLSIYKNKEDIIDDQHSLYSMYFDNFEECLEEGLLEAIKLIEL